MRTLYICLASLSILGLLSCGGQNKNSNQQGEESHSPDLSSFFLQGAVKSVDCGTKISFDVNGRVIEAETGYRNPDVLKIIYDKMPGGVVVNGSIVKRDEEGRILWLGVADNGCSGETGYHFEYGEKGVRKYWYDNGDCSGIVFYEVTKLNENGSPVQEIRKREDEEMSLEETIDYEYVEIDNHGNWTKRNLKILAKTTTWTFDESGEDKVSTEVLDKVEKRNITYYE